MRQRGNAAAESLTIIMILLLGGTAGRACFAADGGEPSPASLVRDVTGNARDNADAHRASEAINGFAIDIYQQLVRAPNADNVFFSPYSVSEALAMTFAGAAGDTAEQMYSVLRLPMEVHEVGSSRAWPIWGRVGVSRAMLQLRRSIRGSVSADAGTQLDIANALFAQKGHPLRKDFLDLVGEYFGARTQTVDFASETAREQARLDINAWVENQTHQRIRELVQKPDLTPDTTLVLTNAVYFKGDWAAGFDPKLTADAPFTLAVGEPRQVAMMQRTDRFGYAETPLLQALEMPYRGDALAMVVLLPRKADGLADVEASLGPTKSFPSLHDILGQLQPRKVHVFLPRFKLECPADLRTPLMSQGMIDAFSPQADFLGMDGSASLSISKVLHKAFVEVNEQGSEAAAATAVVMVPGGPEPALVEFRADRPFLFLIRHKPTGTILFMGRLVNPPAN